MGLLVKSQAGNAFFAIVPGQVLLASLDAISFDFIGVACVGLLLQIELQLSLCFSLSLSLIWTGMDTLDTSPSMLLFFDKQRFIFNVGEVRNSITYIFPVVSFRTDFAQANFLD
ncbi:unnamed protein product [Prunus brigantina]